PTDETALGSGWKTEWVPLVRSNMTALPTIRSAPKGFTSELDAQPQKLEPSQFAAPLSPGRNAIHLQTRCLHTVGRTRGPSVIGCFASTPSLGVARWFAAF